MCPYMFSVWDKVGLNYRSASAWIWPTDWSDRAFLTARLAQGRAKGEYCWLYNIYQDHGLLWHPGFFSPPTTNTWPYLVQGYRQGNLGIPLVISTVKLWSLAANLSTYVEGSSAKLWKYSWKRHREGTLQQCENDWSPALRSRSQTLQNFLCILSGISRCSQKIVDS